MVTRAGDAPFARELPHTADLGFEVSAPTLPLLFERAGLALIDVMVDLRTVVPRRSVPIVLPAAPLDELLQAWLGRLVLLLQVDGLVACELAVDAIDDGGLRGTARGETLNLARHVGRQEVKAVTWHRLAVEPRPDGWSARFVVDV